MARSLLALCTALVFAGSGCAIGLGAPASEVTANSALLNGHVRSSTGGPGSYHLEFGKLGSPLQKRAVHPIDLEANVSQPVSEPVDGLEFGTIYSYRVCAEDGQNAGSPICSQRQHFPTAGVRLRADLDCTFYPPYNFPTARLVAPPGDYEFTWTGPGEGRTDTVTVGSFGFLSISFPRETTGLWTFTAEVQGETLTASVVADCASPS
ncbi:MAG: hypothetical protein JW895_04685 [Thermoleophilaceae bacterium]|nr:hypothetical protein [Thermoleophilaceae bacterium]